MVEMACLCLGCSLQLIEGPTLKTHVPENTTSPVNEIPGCIKFCNLSTHDKSLEI